MTIIIFARSFFPGFLLAENSLITERRLGKNYDKHANSNKRYWAPPKNYLQ